MDKGRKWDKEAQGKLTKGKRKRIQEKDSRGGKGTQGKEAR